MRRVVITGLGIVSPVGNDLASAWDSIANGRSGIGPITHFDASAYTTRIAGQVRDFDPTVWIGPKDVKKMDPFIHYGVAAAFMAMDDAGLEVTEANAERIGALVGSGIGGILGIEEQTAKLLEGGPRKISPFYVPSTIINMLPGQISLMRGIKVMMGAPNLIRGGSHSGNVAALELAELGLLDILSSDYVPSSLLTGAMMLGDQWGNLPRAVATVTSAPADAVGFTDRGQLAVGMRGDVIRVHRAKDLTSLRGTWVCGRRVA